MSTDNTGATPGTPTAEGSGTASQEQVYQLIVDSIEKEKELFKIEKERLKLVEEYGEIQKEGLKVAQAELNQIVSRSEKIAEEISQGKNLLDILKDVNSLSKQRKKAIDARLNVIIKENKSLLDIVKIQKDGVNATNDSIAKQKELIKAEQERIKVAQQEREDAKREFQKKEIDFKEFSQRRNDANDKEAKAKKELAELEKEQQKNLDDLTIKEIELSKTIKQIKKEIVDGAEEGKGALEDYAQIQGKLNDMAGTFVEKFGLAKKSTDTLVGSAILLNKEYEKAKEEFMDMTGEEQKAFGSPMGLALANSINLTNVLGSIVDQIVEIAMQTEKVAKNLMKTTAISKDFSQELVDIFQQSAKFGMTMEDTGKNFNALRENFSAFDQTNSSLNESLGLTVQTLAGLSVDAAKSTKHMDMLHKAFGVSELEAAKLTVELASMGDQMSISADKMVSDFASISSNLAIYGKRSMDVFKGLTAAAKATGIEVGTLVKMAEQFDTFDKAAGAAAKLNAALGTQLSTIDMMNMDHDERINYLRQEVQIATGGNIDDMDKFSQQFIADAMGVEVEHMRRLVNMSEGDYTDYLKQQEDSRKTQAEMAKLAEKSLPMFEQLKLAVTKVAVALSPLILLISGFLIGLTDLNDYMNGSLFVLLPALTGMIIIMRMQTFKLNTALGVIGLTIFALSHIIEYLNNNGFKKAVPYVEALTGSIFALGVALKFSLGGWAQLASVLLTFIGILMVRINPRFINAFAHMAVGVTALGFALQFLGPKAMLGAVALMGLFMAFAYFFSGLADSGENMNSIVTGMALLGIAMAGIGYMFSNPVMIAGAAVFTAMMIGLGAAVMMMGSGFEKMVDSLKAVKDIMKDIDGLSSKTFVAISAEGSRTSAFIGSKDVIESINRGSIDVNVNIPEFDMPKPVVNVFIDGSQITSGIYSTVGRAG